MNLKTLATEIVSRTSSAQRHLVAIAGPPGAGKSTLAEQLCTVLEALGQSAVVVPMDGYHLDNTILNERGLLPRKGAPETFDADGFINIVSRLANASDTVYLPTFDRERDIAIAGANSVSPEVKILLVEGNYLLLNEEPWRQLHQYWGTTVFIDPGIDIVEQRIIQRWLSHGLAPDAATARALSNDIPNARLVLEQSNSAQIDINVSQVSGLSL